MGACLRHGNAILCQHQPLVVEVGHFSRDFCFKNIGVIIGRKTSFVELLTCFEFFDSCDGFVKEILKLSLELFLLLKD